MSQAQRVLRTRYGAIWMMDFNVREKLYRKSGGSARGRSPTRRSRKDALGWAGPPNNLGVAGRCTYGYTQTYVSAAIGLSGLAQFEQTVASTQTTTVFDSGRDAKVQTSTRLEFVRRRVLRRTCGPLCTRMSSEERGWRCGHRLSFSGPVEQRLPRKFAAGRQRQLYTVKDR
ncbi:hypothetical protein EXIGLDRAFT_21688 [Exidia glandulosa HHB12029]|uniref:Uncharacterized protein n=1 Tax=Exidia glandulosa HHB12029 TaxID=1314781 RepID=A0A165QZK7_EXIGL|nr:hypothetical protein EXIGLDRAFT_21688 [Exidia glandulosa HHB12029]